MASDVLKSSNPLPGFKGGLRHWRIAGPDGCARWCDKCPEAGIAVADADFGACLEMVLTSSTQRLTCCFDAFVPGRLYQLSARIKSMSKVPAMCRVHMGSAQDERKGKWQALTTYGVIVELSGLAVAKDARASVGLEFQGPVGSAFRIAEVALSDMNDAWLG